MGTYLSLSGSGRKVLWGGGERLFEAGRLLTFSAFRMGAYSRWALIRINTVAAIKETAAWFKFRWKSASLLSGRNNT